ncbi:hypothetical protein N0V94_004622 [Neodidymelliopsis sp. IMI 364377]|nr:hypothetical protein N0V94_004622 [Neodidymelliopsis sp. IMI 364377]
MSDDEGPKYRLGSKIAKGELRIGTHTLFTNDEESRWYMAWRHWGCATKHQINGLEELTDNDPTKAPGYDRLSPESKEEVRLTFENSRINDPSFKDIRADLAGNSAKFGAEIRDAEGYKVDMPVRAAACRGSECLNKGTKVVKGELRVGFLRSFDGEHSSWVYKHWNCISNFDIRALKNCYEQDTSNGLDGLEKISTDYKQAVLDTLNTSKLVQVTQSEEPAAKPKKTRSKKAKANQEESEDEPPKPKRSRKKRAAAEVKASSEEEPDYVPRKTRSRSTKTTEETDPAIAKIEAMAARMREDAAPR